MDEFSTVMDGEGLAAYLCIAFLLYAIREASKISNRYIPLAGAALGLLFAVVEHNTFNYAVLIHGIGIGLLGVGSVATIKYSMTKKGVNRNE